RTPRRSDPRPRPSGRRAHPPRAPRASLAGRPHGTSSWQRRVDVALEILERLELPCLGIRDSLLELGRNARLELRDRTRVDLLAGDEQIDRVSPAPLLDLGLRSVEIRVRHRMRAIAVRLELDEVRAAAGTDGLDGPLRRRLDSEDVHAVHDLRRHAVALRADLHVELRL